MFVNNCKDEQIEYDHIRMTIQLDERVPLCKPIYVIKNGIEIEAYISVTSEDLRGINTELDALLDSGWEIEDIFPREIDLRYSIKKK